MEAVVIILVLVVLGVLVGTGLALVRGRRGGDTTLEPPPSAPAVTDEDLSAPPVEVAPDEKVEADVVAEAEAVAAAAAPVEVAPAPTRPRFRDRLSKARGLLSGYVGSLTGRSRIDQEAWDELEEALIRADVGVDATQELLDVLRTQVKEQSLENGAQLLDALKVELTRRLGGFDVELVWARGRRAVRVAVRRASTASARPRPSASWASARPMPATRSSWPRATPSAPPPPNSSACGPTAPAPSIVRGNEGGDPGAVIFDAVEAASARGADLVLADTAGRLHTKVNLMDELRKVRRVADKGAGDVTEVLLVLDATTGQNGLVQAAQFTEAVEVTGVVLTKLDGSAKGGIVVAIQTQLGIPVKLVGLGEGVEDLVPFEADEFVEALFS